MFRFLAMVVLGFSVMSTNLYAEENVLEVRTYEKGQIGHGSAFFISPKRLLTAAHNLDGATKISIIKDNKEIACKLVDVDKKADIGLIEAEEANTTWLVLDDQKQEVYTIAYPEGKGPRVSEGKSQSLWFTIYFEVGSSGAPIIKKNTNVVVGMGVQTVKDDRHTCIAIPADVLKAFVDKHKETK